MSMKSVATLARPRCLVLRHQQYPSTILQVEKTAVHLRQKTLKLHIRIAIRDTNKVSAPMTRPVEYDTKNADCHERELRADLRRRCVERVRHEHSSSRLGRVASSELHLNKAGGFKFVDEKPDAFFLVNNFASSIKDLSVREWKVVLDKCLAL